MQATEGREVGVDLDDDLLCALDDLWGGADRGAEDQRAVFEDLGRLDQSVVEREARVARLLVEGVVPVLEILRELGEMDVRKFEVAWEGEWISWEQG